VRHRPDQAAEEAAGAQEEESGHWCSTSRTIAMITATP